MKDEKLYLIHIAESLRRIETYIQGGKAEFMKSTMIQDAVIRNFEVIGEAAKQISEDIKEQYLDLPWRRIAGFRDVLIHAYARVRLDEVWNIIEQDLPELKRKIDVILKDFEDRS
ncbi:MAG: DUF86 domain-containing protein [Planctomycetota bacterium]|nr:MAG: DUF86 domain-containing protein [Planctomycetota bacterium]